MLLSNIFQQALEPVTKMDTWMRIAFAITDNAPEKTCFGSSDC